MRNNQATTNFDRSLQRFGINALMSEANVEGINSSIFKNLNTDILQTAKHVMRFININYPNEERVKFVHVTHNYPTKTQLDAAKKSNPAENSSLEVVSETHIESTRLPIRYITVYYPIPTTVAPLTQSAVPKPAESISLESVNEIRTDSTVLLTEDFNEIEIHKLFQETISRFDSCSEQILELEKMFKQKYIFTSQVANKHSLILRKIEKDIARITANLSILRRRFISDRKLDVLKSIHTFLCTVSKHPNFSVDKQIQVYSMLQREIKTLESVGQSLINSM